MNTDDNLARARAIKLLIFDVDGILTDGSLFYGNDGEEYKAFNSRDGHGIKMLRASGVEAAIITGRTSQVVAHRARNLGIARIVQGSEDKLASFRELIDELGLSPEQTAFMGDDVVDLPVMRRCGLAITVPEAPAEVSARAHLVTRAGGGRGAAREACEFLMRAQGTWMAQLSLYDR